MEAVHNSVEHARNPSLTTIRAVMARIYVGKVFTFAGHKLSPSEAFDSKGMLALFVSRAMANFRLMFPSGIRQVHCATCGEMVKGLSAKCDVTCGFTSGQSSVGFPLDLVQPDDEDAVLGFAVEGAKDASSMLVTLLFILDVARELEGPTPRQEIAIDTLLPDLNRELMPILEARAKEFERRLEAERTPAANRDAHVPGRTR